MHCQTALALGVPPSHLPMPVLPLQTWDLSDKDVLQLTYITGPSSAWHPQVSITCLTLGMTLDIWGL